MLWERLRKRQLLGLKFRRRHPVGPLTADFYCPELEVVIELDGNDQRQKDYRTNDLIREELMESNELTVISVSTTEVQVDLDGVMEKVTAQLKTMMNID